MGEQLFIIGATGTAKPGLVAALMAVLAANGLQVRHASRRYQGETTFETGGPHDLQLELGGVASTAEAATLETLLAELRGHREEFRAACNGTKPAAPAVPAKETRNRKSKAQADAPKLEEPSAKPPTELLNVEESHEEQSADADGSAEAAEEKAAEPAAETENQTPEAGTQTDAP